VLHRDSMLTSCYSAPRHMQLPQALQHFPEATLLIVTDEEAAKCWLAGGDSLEALDGVSLPHERKSDDEGASIASFDGTRRSDPSADKHDTPRKNTFATLVANRVASVIHQGHAAKIRIASPPEILHLIESHLPHDMRERILSRTAKNLMQYPEIELVEKILDLKPE
jgi:protein required for attachment to host cells